MESYKIDEIILEKIKALGLPEKKENNPYILLHVYGDGVRASNKFNAKVYEGKKGLKLVTNDYHTLMNLIENKIVSEKDYKRIIYIDDSNWGCAIGGVLVGAYDTLAKKVKIKVIDVKFFQEPLFSQKAYLDEYAKNGIELVNEFNTNPNDALIRICTGYLNTKLKEELRKIGFNVEVAEIGEPLQTEIENKAREYVKSFGYDKYYDPKQLMPAQITDEFNKTISWLKEKNLMKFAKTGWNYFKPYDA